MYISHNEKWAPVGRQRSGGSPPAEAVAEHGKVRRQSRSGAAERSRRAGMNMNDEARRRP